MWSIAPRNSEAPYRAFVVQFQFAIVQFQFAMSKNLYCYEVTSDSDSDCNPNDSEATESEIETNAPEPEIEVEVVEVEVVPRSAEPEEEPRPEESELEPEIEIDFDIIDFDIADEPWVEVSDNSDVATMSLPFISPPPLLSPIIPESYLLNPVLPQLTPEEFYTEPELQERPIPHETPVAPDNTPTSVSPIQTVYEYGWLNELNRQLEENEYNNLESWLKNDDDKKYYDMIFNPYEVYCNFEKSEQQHQVELPQPVVELAPAVASTYDDCLIREAGADEDQITLTPMLTPMEIFESTLQQFDQDYEDWWIKEPNF